VFFRETIRDTTFSNSSKSVGVMRIIFLKPLLSSMRNLLKQNYMPLVIFFPLKMSTLTIQADCLFPCYLSLWKKHYMRLPEHLFLHDSRQTSQMFWTSTRLCKHVTMSADSVHWTKSLGTSPQTCPFGI
jgi:hypothetical protein